MKKTALAIAGLFWIGTSPVFAAGASSLADSGETKILRAGSTASNERFLDDTQKRYAVQEKLDLQTLPTRTLIELTADSLQRSVVLQKFVKEGSTANFDDARLVGKAKALLPKIQAMSRTQYAAMQNATFQEKKANVRVVVTGTQSEVLQYTAANFNQAARDYLLNSMRSNEMIRQLGFRSVAIVRDGVPIEKIDL